MARLALAAMLVTALTTPIHSESASQPLTVTRVVSLEYPWMANLAGVQGRVEIEGLVSSEGRLDNIRSVSGSPLLLNPAKGMLSRWRFASCNAERSQCEITFTIVFELAEICDRPKCPTDMQIDLPNKIVLKTRRAPAIVN